MAISAVAESVGVVSAVAAATVVATAAIGSAAAIVATFELAKGIGKSLVESVRIVAEGAALRKDLLKKYKESIHESLDEKNLLELKENIISYFSKIGTLYTEKEARDMLDKIPDLKDQIEKGYELLEIEARHSELKENMKTLDELADKLGIDIDEEIKDYASLKEGGVEHVKEKIELLSKKIEEKIEKCQKAFEEELKKLKFEPKYIKVEDVEEKLIASVLDTRLSDMLANPKDEETIKLATRKKALDKLVEINNTCYTMMNDPIFEKYASRIFDLWNSCINLANDESLNDEDFAYGINVRLEALQSLRSEMNEDMKKKLDLHVRFNELLNATNNMRALLGLPPRDIIFNPKTANDDIALLESEIKELIEQYNKEQLSAHISLELKKKYTRLSYRHIPDADKVEHKGKHTIRKSYYVTPDGKNVLCVNVNENGVISEEVVGVKIYGLEDDKMSILEAQKTFCKDNKKVLSELFSELGDEDPTVINHEPDLKDAVAIDLSDVLPKEEIETIGNNRRGKVTKVKKKKVI